MNTTKRIPPHRPRTAEPDAFDVWIAEIDAALSERRRVFKLNAEARLLAGASGPTALVKLEPGARAILVRESAARRATRAKPPEAWAKDIAAKLRGPLRNRVASIVWWDFFGSRPALKRWAHLDAWLGAEFAAVDNGDLARALWAVGFSPHHARLRAAGEWEEGGR